MENLLMVILFLVTLFMLALSAVSGARAMSRLHSHALFKWDHIISIAVNYVRHILGCDPEFDRPNDGRAWCVLFCALWLSTSSAVLFFTFQLIDLINFTWTAIGAARKSQWLLAHILEAAACILFHAAVFSAAKNQPEIFDARKP